MLGRGGFGRAPAWRAESLGQNALQLVGNLCFALFVLGVLVFTIIAATYRPDDPLLRPAAASPLTSFLSSSSNATFRSDSDSALRTGEDFLNSTSADAAPFIELKDIAATTAPAAEGALSDVAGVAEGCDPAAPVECAAPEAFHTMMRAAIERFPDVHFYRFGKPVAVPAEEERDACDMAWRFRPKDARRAGFYKDYRRFRLARAPNCTLSVLHIGDYHSGVLARKKGKKRGKQAPSKDVGFEAKREDGSIPAAAEVVPVVGEAVNDTLPVVASEGAFSRGRYLLYTGGGDRCKSMNHYLWSFLCALGEAQYLNRTLVMDTTICLSSTYTSSQQDEEGKDFRFYFDFEHLRDSASVLEQREFWSDWGKWQKKDGLNLHLVEDFRVTPMKLAGVQDTLIMRKFGAVEPDNYWYRVCEGETESVIQRPWHLIWKSRRLLDIVSGIASRMNWDFDAVHVVRGEKAKNTQLWPNLAADTSPDALLATLSDKIEDSRHLYIATNEPDTSFFDPLKVKYTIHFLDYFMDLWDVNSEWYTETMKLNNNVPVEFDGYMRVQVDTEVFLRGKKQLETFNDLTSDCKDGVGACHTASS